MDEDWRKLKRQGKEYRFAAQRSGVAIPIQVGDVLELGELEIIENGIAIKDPGWSGLENPIVLILGFGDPTLEASFPISPRASKVCYATSWIPAIYKPLILNVGRKRRLLAINFDVD